MLVVPVYNKLIVPYADIYFQTPDFEKLAGRGVALNEKVTLLVLKNPQTREDWTDESFYPIGVSGVVSEISQDGYIGVKTMNRVNVDSAYVNSDHTIDLTLSRRNDIQDLDETASYQKLQALKKEIVQFSEGYQWGAWVKAYAEHISSIGTLAAGVSPWLTISNEERYQILEEDSEAKRTEKLEQVLYEYLEVAKVTGEANASQQKEYQDRYREAAIRRQMEYLQKELDEMHPENISDVQKFEKKINESGMNEAGGAGRPGGRHAL